MVFLIAGAWPVFGFFGLDVLLIYWAFRANYRAAGAYEEVTVTTGELVVRKVSHRGQVRQWTFNPLWAKLQREEHEEFGLERLFLVSQGTATVDRGLSRPAREGRLRGCACGGPGRSPARAGPEPPVSAEPP